MEIRRNPPKSTIRSVFFHDNRGSRRSPERQRRETPRHIAAMNARDRPWKPGQLLRILGKAESERRKWRFWIKDGWDMMGYDGIWWDMIWYDNGDEVYDMFGDIFKRIWILSPNHRPSKGTNQIATDFSLSIMPGPDSYSSLGCLLSGYWFFCRRWYRTLSRFGRLPSDS
jgi:hypothetical protein